nr:hypothetical protein [uncultured Lichenicoccus sp.]
MYNEDRVWQFSKYNPILEEFNTSSRYATASFIARLDAVPVGDAIRVDRKYLTERGATVKFFDPANPMPPAADERA